MTDSNGRPYFLWDCELTLVEFVAALDDDEDPAAAYLLGKLMRQAKPDDVFTFLTLDDIADLWHDLRRHLGRTLPFWTWILGVWGVIER